MDQPLLVGSYHPSHRQETKTPSGVEGFGVSAVGYGVLTPVALASLVPEVSSWIMMILGVGAVGGALRRRSKVSTTVYIA